MAGSSNALRGLVGALLIAGLLGFRFYSRIVGPRRPAASAPAAASLATNPAPTPSVRGGSRTTFPDLGPGRAIEPGVRFHEVVLGPPWSPGRAPGQSGKLWVYSPEGDAAPASLAGVVIRGAGSPMITGMNLGDGDRPEHLPWARAGFVVVAYELDGARDGPEAGDAELVRSIQGFLAAQAGLVNARAALDFIAAKLPQVDPKRILSVGHSSAGTTALLAAEDDKRISGCVAFAPGQYDVPPERAQVIQQLTEALPGAGDFLTRFNPATNLEKLNVPVFLFSAADDSVVPAARTAALAKSLEGLGRSATLATGPNGGHYEAMVQDGVPQAIAWARELNGKRPE